MTGEGDDGSNRNRTVFRPSPLQRLKKEGQQRPRLSDPEDAQWAPSGSDDGGAADALAGDPTPPVWNAPTVEGGEGRRRDPRWRRRGSAKTTFHSRRRRRRSAT